jgi:hypothetical protein
VAGNLPSDAALNRILKGTGLVTNRDPSGVITITPGHASSQLNIGDIRLAQATPPSPRAAVETVTVTSSKLGGADVQSIPIAITALSQEQLTATQTAGGPDLGWRRGVLVFRHATLAEAAEEFNRYNAQKIVIADPETARLTFSATLPTHDTKAFVRILGKLFDTHDQSTTEGIVISR